MSRYQELDQELDLVRSPSSSLMDERGEMNKVSVRTVMEALFRQRHGFLIVFTAVTLLGALYIFGSHKKYASQMKLLVQNSRSAQVISAGRSEAPATVSEVSEEQLNSELEVLLYEFKADLNAYLAGLGPKAPVHSLKEIIEFNEKHREKELPYFGQDLFTKAEAKGPLTEKAYLELLEKNHLMSRDQGIDFVLKKEKLDALIAPTGGPAWPTDWINGDHFAGGYSTASAVAGYPHITVPAGYVFGLPVGISFFASAYSEPTLIKFAYAFEQATRARRPPQFWPTAKI